MSRFGRIILGALIGALAGAIVAVNVVIFSGSEQGYETSIPEVFRRSAALGALVVLILGAGPVVGGVVAARNRGRIVVREAVAGDVEAIARFFREAWAMTGPDAPGWAGADEATIEYLTRPDVLRERLGGPERRMFLAFDGSRVVGFSATRWEGGDAAELAGIVVLQDMVGRGIGTPLLEAAVAALAAARVRQVLVRTEADNDRAVGFYRSRGFGDERLIVDDVEGTSMELVELRRTL